ncbi:hypothetical protein GCM10010129_03060 [Streptomyces fumigatiscleroticus]|nr:hypothetical protein GCM10010129_03060 [Streptomyces fumigatiscleroticus]
MAADRRHPSGRPDGDRPALPARRSAVFRTSPGSVPPDGRGVRLRQRGAAVAAHLEGVRALRLARCSPASRTTGRLRRARQDPAGQRPLRSTGRPATAATAAAVAPRTRTAAAPTSPGPPERVSVRGVHRSSGTATPVCRPAARRTGSPAAVPGRTTTPSSSARPRAPARPQGARPGAPPVRERTAGRHRAWRRTRVTADYAHRYGGKKIIPLVIAVKGA